MKHDLETLRRFNRKVARLEASGFAKRYAEDIPNVVAKFEQPKFKDCGDGKFEIYGRITSWLEDFSQDENDAFVLTHRNALIGRVSRAMSKTARDLRERRDRLAGLKRFEPENASPISF